MSNIEWINPVRYDADFPAVRDSRTLMLSKTDNPMFTVGVDKENYLAYLEVVQANIDININSRLIGPIKSALCSGYIPICILPILTHNSTEDNKLQEFFDKVLEALQKHKLPYVFKSAIQFCPDPESEFRKVSDIWVSRIDVQRMFYPNRPAYTIKVLDVLEALGCL